MRLTPTPLLTPLRKKQAIEALQAAIAAIEILPPATPCSECLNFEKGHCRRWGAEVPQEHRGHGCGEFEDEIPF